LKKVKDSDNIEDIKKRTEELSQVAQKAGADLYKKEQEKKPEEKEEEKKPEEKEEEKKPEEGEYKEKENK